uniref:Uncharacterized protein n=1 Tax=Anguilla anguilla TaxID=7936 RepID=A0A0E9UET8_ANGAN
MRRPRVLALIWVQTGSAKRIIPVVSCTRKTISPLLSFSWTVNLGVPGDDPVHVHPLLIISRLPD